VVVGNVVCWGAVALVWIAGALYNAVRAPRARIRGPIVSPELLAAIVLCAVITIPAHRIGGHLSVDAAWVRVLGLAVLVASTAFALWARFSLGTMWSAAPRVGGDQRLRTGGPYAVTRHPIYTGLLGMLLGTTLLGGVGQWWVLIAVGLIALEAKIRMEERLLVATFPDEYPRYRRAVPQLVPGLNALRRRLADTHKTRAPEI
jgi:protein-S-isoprenylcysteine O-methyltransferase Ste14